MRRATLRNWHWAGSVPDDRQLSHPVPSPGSPLHRILRFRHRPHYFSPRCSATLRMERRATTFEGRRAQVKAREETCATHGNCNPAPLTVGSRIRRRLLRWADATAWAADQAGRTWAGPDRAGDAQGHAGLVRRLGDDVPTGTTMRIVRVAVTGQVWPRHVPDVARLGPTIPRVQDTRANTRRTRGCRRHHYHLHREQGRQGKCLQGATRAGTILPAWGSNRRRVDKCRAVGRSGAGVMCEIDRLLETDNDDNG